jgi:hypothetical protein
MYKAIIAETDKFDANLTLKFGLLSYECENEKEYIEKAKKLIYEMFKYTEDDVDDVFFEEQPVMEYFHKTLNKLLTNIATLKK